MPDETFVSYAQNGEDVVLWRALKDAGPGAYIEVGANDPVQHSISKAFHDRGWRGLLVEPVPYFAERLRAARPDETVAEVAISPEAGQVTLHVFPNTGLSTVADSVSASHLAAGFEGEDIAVPARRLSDLIDETGLGEREIQFLMVDVEGYEAHVIETIDFTRHRPWILVIESTEPLSTRQTHGSWESEVLAAGYEFVLFDGLSRYFVAREKAAELGPALSYPASVFDDYEPRGRFRALYDDREAALAAEQQARSELVAEHDRAEAAAVRAATAENMLRDIQTSQSWRITAPLRRLAATFQRRSR